MRFRETESFQSAALAVSQLVGQRFGWPFGALLIRDLKDGLLKCRKELGVDQRRVRQGHTSRPVQGRRSSLRRRNEEPGRSVSSRTSISHRVRASPDRPAPPALKFAVSVPILVGDRMISAPWNGMLAKLERRPRRKLQALRRVRPSSRRPSRRDRASAATETMTECFADQYPVRRCEPRDSVHQSRRMASHGAGEWSRSAGRNSSGSRSAPFMQNLGPPSGRPIEKLPYKASSKSAARAWSFSQRHSRCGR